MESKSDQSDLQELLDVVEASEKKFITKQAFLVLLRWVLSRSEKLDELIADCFEEVSDDEPSVGNIADMSRDVGCSEDALLDAMEEKASLSASSSDKTVHSSHPTVTQELAEVLGRSSFAELATRPPHLRTPQEDRLLREFHPLGARSTASRST